ncbi:MAG: hypothetical protein ABIP85_02025 [Chthoniobacteraceae bacterium]
MQRMSTKKKRQAKGKSPRWLLGIQAIFLTIGGIASGIVKFQKNVAYIHEHGAETVRQLAPLLYHLGAVTFSTYVRFFMWSLILGIPVLLIMKSVNRKDPEPKNADEMIGSLFKNPAFVLIVFGGCLAWSIYDQLTQPDLAFTREVTVLTIALQLLGVLVLLWAAYAISFIFKKSKDAEEASDDSE